MRAVRLLRKVLDLMPPCITRHSEVYVYPHFEPTVAAPGGSRRCYSQEARKASTVPWEGAAWK